MSETNSSVPSYASLLTAGGGYTPFHYDYTFLAHLAYVVGKNGAKKLFFIWPPNENNLSFIKARARGESTEGWEDS